MKTHFLSAASHALRQPLQTISLLAAVLERQVINPQAFSTLSKLNDATAQMRELIDSLLDVSLIESGDIEVEIENLSLRSLFDRLADDLMPIAIAKGLELRCVQSSFIIRCDRRLITRMLNNLLSNAIKYTDKGKILFGCHRRGQNLYIEVLDTGTGVPLESINSIFRGEFKCDNHKGIEWLSQRFELYIVRRFAEQLGYRLEARSIPGKGSVFTIIIPNSSIVSDESSGSAITPADADRPCVLLIRDDRAQRDALKSLLELEGYSVVAARNGPAILAKLSELPPKRALIIVTDAVPTDGMDGLHVIQQIRKTLHRQIPALILNPQEAGSSNTQQTIDDCQFLMEPINPHYLLAGIEGMARLCQPSWHAPAQTKQRLTVPFRTPPSADSEVAVIDDEASICDAIRAILAPGGYKVEVFLSAEAYLADPQHSRFKCLIVDIDLPGMSGTELISKLSQHSERPQIIFLTGETTLSTATQTMPNGNAEFLRKPVQGATLLQSVANVLRSERATPVDPIQQADLTSRLARLTTREREVLMRVIKGEMNKNIASDLGISERTTEHHRQNVMRKMEVKSLAALVRIMSSFVEG